MANILPWSFMMSATCALVANSRCLREMTKAVAVPTLRFAHEHDRFLEALDRVGHLLNRAVGRLRPQGQAFVLWRQTEARAELVGWV